MKPNSLPLAAIQNVAQGALAIMNDFNGPSAISLARGVLEYIANVSTDILRQCQGDMSKFVYAVCLAVQARRTEVEKGSQSYIDVHRALAAATKLNYRGQGGIISRDFIRILQSYSATGTFVEPPQPEDPSYVPSRPPFTLTVPEDSLVPERQVRHRDQPQYYAVDMHSYS